MNNRNILAITGIRSEYDILYPVLCELDSSHELNIAVSGAHLSSSYYNTWERIREDGFKIADKIDKSSLTALSFAKESLNFGYKASIDNAIKNERELINKLTNLS